MTNLCPALADALRKLAKKRPDKFRLGDSALIVPPKSLLWIGSGENLWCVDLTQLHIPKWFMLDDMDAVAAALGMEFEVFRLFPNNSASDWVYRLSKSGALLPMAGIGEAYDSKRTASLAALLAIITHALQEDGK